ncbi:hypothetical protein Tco_1012218 [Tanacetum coccineum]
MGDVVAMKMYNDGVLYKLNLLEEPPFATVVHHETIGLLIANEHSKLTEARARGCHVNVVEYGTVKLQLTTGNVLTLNNVFHMPAIVKCCISMNKLIEMGLGVAFHGEGCYVNKSDQIVGNGFVEDGMFCLGVIDERSGGN